MSRLDSLYRQSPVWLQTLAVSLFGLRLRRLRYGGIHRAVLDELRRTQWLSRDELTALQRDRLNTILRVAAEVPVYRKLWGSIVPSADDLATLPLIQKADVQADRHTVTHPRFRDMPLREIHTGGTTGRTLAIYCTPSVLQTNYAFFARLREWAGIPESGRVATFAGRVVVPPAQDRPPFWRRNFAGRQLLCSSYHLSERTVGAYADALAAFAPELIDSYPSSLEPIARFVIDRGITSIRPHAVITSSETLSAEVRDLLVRAFAAPVFDHYGSAEMAALISQCASGSYHVNPEFGIVEVFRGDVAAAPGETGELVATGFINPVMPLIRYRMGDLAVASTASCDCGRAFPVIAQVLGRVDDVVVTPEGRRVGRLDPIFKSVSSLYEARVIQDETDHVVIEVVVRAGLPEHERRDLVHEAGLRLGPKMRIDVAVVDAIPRTASGKLRMVENRVHARAAVSHEHDR
jgi:phenylacetate-CoA ligase